MRATGDVRSQWLTTSDAARMLRVTPQWVRDLARAERLAFERTRSRRLLFRQHDVLRLVDRRATVRLEGMTTARPVPDGEPRQLALFGGARLKLATLVQDGSRSLCNGKVDDAGSVNESGGQVRCVR
jgi:excisionase family DNA binding protein